MSDVDAIQAYAQVMPVATEAEVISSTRQLLALLDPAAPTLPVIFSTRMQRALGKVSLRRMHPDAPWVVTRITFSADIMLQREQYRRDTIAHEIAHVIAIALGDQGHGAEWRAAMRLMGFRPDVGVRAWSEEGRELTLARQVAGRVPVRRKRTVVRVEVGCGCRVNDVRVTYSITPQRAARILDVPGAVCRRCLSPFTRIGG